MRPPAPTHKPWLWALLPAVLFLTVTVPFLGDYGPGWDFGVVYYGEHYLDFYLSGCDSEYLAFDSAPAPDSIPSQEPSGEASPTAPSAQAGDRFDVAKLCTQGPELSWPVGPLAAAITRRITQAWLGILDVDEGYHLACLILAALAIGALCRFARRTLGPMAALAAAFFLATYPAFVGLSFHDPKDIPAAAFFTLAVLLGARAAERRSLRSVLLFGVVLGVALGAKTNAVFVPLILLLWWLASAIHRSTRLALPARVWIGAIVAGAVVAPLVFFLLWPWLWLDPVHNLASHIQRVWEDRYGAASLGQSFLEASLTTPPLVLIFATLGIVFWRHSAPGRSRRTLVLALIWLCVPLLRSSAPNVRYYDGVRRFIEFVPPLALLAGWGAQALSDALARSSLARPALARWGAGALVLLAGVPAVTTHPDQVAYYNLLVGGTKGAQAAGYEAATDLWASSYRRAMEWLARHAEPDPVVLVPVAPHVARMARDLHGRADITIVSPPFLDAEQIPTGSFYVLYVTKHTYYDAVVRVCEAKGKPVMEWDLDGAPLCRLYRIDAGSEAYRLIRQGAALARARTEASVRSLVARANRPDADPRDVGAYVHAVMQLRGVDAAIEALDGVIALVNDPDLVSELTFFRGQIERSRPFEKANRTSR